MESLLGSGFRFLTIFEFERDERGQVFFVDSWFNFTGTCRCQTFDYLIPTVDSVIREDDFHTRKNQPLSRMQFGQDSFSGT